MHPGCSVQEQNFRHVGHAGNGPFGFKKCAHDLQHVGYQDGPLVYDHHPNGVTVNGSITPKFLQSLHVTSCLDSVILEHYNQRGYHAAVHVRRDRGDVGASSRRSANDQVNLEVVRQVEELLGWANVNVHIFGTTMGHHGSYQWRTRKHSRGAPWNNAKILQQE